MATSCVLWAGPAAAEGTARLAVPAAAFGTIRPPSPGASCRDAITVAERTHAIPRGLLRAIGLQESGRRDPATGQVEPWPWTVDVDGHGTLFATAEEAVAFVADAQRNGAASIDVGCMQINLQQHPAAFRTLEEAFDPVANTEYGARFLASLFAETGDWTLSTGYYHSRTAGLAVPYRLAVAARMPGGGPLAAGMALAAAAPPPPSPLATLAAAWAATLPAGSAPPPAIRSTVSRPPDRRAGAATARAAAGTVGFFTAAR